MAIDVKKLKAIRQQTGAGVADIRKALEKAQNDEKKALELLKEWGLEKAGSKSDRAVSAGLVETYIHGGRVGAIVEINCETDFVAKTQDFKNFAKEVAMQVSAMQPQSVDELENQAYIRDNSRTVGDLRKSLIAKLGENIVIKRFMRFEVGS